MWAGEGLVFAHSRDGKASSRRRGFWLGDRGVWEKEIKQEAINDVDKVDEVDQRNI